jgi:phosphatidylglycerol:prolipoprotein diacylglycerol transferase
MLPVLFRISFDSPATAVLGYFLAALLIAYFAYSGWRGAGPPLSDKASDKDKAAARNARVRRAAVFGIIGAVIARWGLSYALPERFFLGGRGEGIPVHTYGILLASGFMLAVTLAAQLAQREWRGAEGEQKKEQVYDLAFWVFIAAILGSKLLFILVNWRDYSGRWGEYFQSPAKVFEFFGGGLVFYGGLIGASAAAYIYTRVHHFDFLRLADLALPTVSLGQCLGRLGCFSAGCCWGEIGKGGLLWGVHFPGNGAQTLFGNPAGVSSLAYQSQASDRRWVVEATGEILHHAAPGASRISDWVASHGHTLAVHPTQLYESIGQLALFVFLMVMRRHRRFHGQILGLWLLAYSVLRSTVELFRGDVDRGTLHGLLAKSGLTSLAEKVPLEAWYNISTSQFISLGMFVVGAVILYRGGRGVWFHKGAPAPAAA